MTAETHTTASAPGGALAAVGPALDRLLDAVAAPVTCRRPWLEAWLACYADFEPLVVAVGGADRLTAAAVLAARRGPWRTDVVAAGDGPSDRIVLAALDENAAEELAARIAAALARLRRPWTLSVSQLPVGDAAAASLARRLHPAELRPAVAAPVLELGEARTLDAYASRSYRQTLRTSRNRIERERVDAAVATATAPGEVAALVRESEQVRLARDRAERRPSTLRDPRQRAFRRTVLERLAREGAVELTTLRLEGRLAAYAVVLLDGPVRRLWDTAFEPRFARFGPGHLVLERVLRDALADDACSALDFMRGLDAYKLRLATGVVESATLTAWSSSRTRALAHLAAGWRSPAYYRWLARWTAARARTLTGRRGAGSRRRS